MKNHSSINYAKHYNTCNSEWTLVWRYLCVHLDFGSSMHCMVYGQKVDSQHFLTQWGHVRFELILLFFWIGCWNSNNSISGSDPPSNKLACIFLSVDSIQKAYFNMRHHVHTLNAILKAHIISILVTEAYFSSLHSSYFFLFPSSFLHIQQNGTKTFFMQYLNFSNFAAF